MRLPPANARSLRPRPQIARTGAAAYARSFQLNYAKASDIAASVRGASNGAEQKDMRGSIIFDDRTNNLIAT